MYFLYLFPKKIYYRRHWFKGCDKIKYHFDKKMAHRWLFGFFSLIIITWITYENVEDFQNETAVVRTTLKQYVLNKPRGLCRPRGLCPVRDIGTVYSVFQIFCKCKRTRKIINDLITPYTTHIHRYLRFHVFAFQKLFVEDERALSHCG